MKKVILLGASGSIGASAIQVLEKYRDDLELVAFSCHSNIEVLNDIKLRFPNAKCCLSKDEQENKSVDFTGYSGLKDMIYNVDSHIVLNGIAGSSGLYPSWWALDSGNHLALANKESIVMAGNLILNFAKSKGLTILPVDSEHSAIFHLLQGKNDINEIILTASGGPFFEKQLEEMKFIKPEEALKHPTWDMGGKITIDSASLANKGLELIEAHYLFALEPERLKVVVHRESLVHSFIRTKDHALYAQISKPNMKLPIQNALLYPELKEVDGIHINPWDLNMSFYPVDNLKFPMLSLAYRSIELGQQACIAYNAANEVAVDAFLNGDLAFTQIATLVEKTLNAFIEKKEIRDIETVIKIDSLARKKAVMEKENLLCC